jgi:hypothetical protein
MTEAERATAIKAHGVAHEKKIARQKAARLARYERNSKRGLRAAVELMKIGGRK